MNIEKLKSGSYRIREDYNGKTYRVTVSYKPTKKEAAELIRQKIESADAVPTEARTFGDACCLYVELKRNILSPSTITGYHAIMRALSPEFMSQRLTDLTALDVQKEINSHSATHSPKSTRNAHGFISAVLRTYRPKLVLNTTLPQKIRFDPNTPTLEDVKKILAAVKGTRYEIPYRLACYGLRRSEVCALYSSDLDGNFLTIQRALVKDGRQYVFKDHPKTTESHRQIYLDDDLCAMIREKDGLLFDGYPDRLGSYLDELQKRLGIPHVRFHDFRAYYVSLAHSLGVPDAYIMANGGWSSSYVMQRVYRRTLSDHAAEVNKLVADALK